MIRLKAMVGLSIQTAIATRVIGPLTNPTVSVPIGTPMAPYTAATGSKTCSTGLESNFRLDEAPDTLACSLAARKTGSVA